MAALRPCPPSSHGARGASQLGISSSRPSPVRLAIQPLARPSALLPNPNNLKTSAPRLRHRNVIRAHKAAADWPFGLDPDDDRYTLEEKVNKFCEALRNHCKLDEDMPFRQEIETIDEYWEKMTSWNTSIFHMEATALSLYLCMVAKKGVSLASRIMDSVALRPDKQDEISLRTKRTLTMQVSIFVKLAEETYDKNFDEESVFSLLGAYKGVAAAGYNLLQDALSSVNYVEHSSSDHSLLVQDTDKSWHEFEQNIKDLEDKFRAALVNNPKAYARLRPTMDGAMIPTMFFVSKMVARHESLLGYLPGTKGRRRATTERASDAGEHDSSGSGFT